jgi:hypothetical protein
VPFAGFGPVAAAAAGISLGFEGARLASPAAGERFDMALADAKAALGESFIPALNQATDAIRALGDIAVTAGEGLTKGKDFIDSIFPKDAVEKMERKGYGKPSDMLTMSGFGAFAKIAKMLGISQGQSVGKAAQGANFFTSESLAERGYASAYGTGLSSNERTAEASEGILDLLQNSIGKAGVEAGHIAANVTRWLLD